jgi:hypothetical protein
VRKKKFTSAGNHNIQSPRDGFDSRNSGIVIGLVA